MDTRAILIVIGVLVILVVAWMFFPRADTPPGKVLPSTAQDASDRLVSTAETRPERVVKV